MSDRQLKRDRRSPLDTEVLQYQDLRELSGKTHLASVEAWARSQGIRYKRDGKGGIWTTVTALNVALGVTGERADAPLSIDLF